MSLAVKVSAAPDMGRANGAVVEVLAKAFRVPKSRIAIVSGETNRNKIVFVSGDTAVLAAGITEFLEDLGKKGIEDGKDH